MAGQTDFIVLRRTGPGSADLEVCGVAYSRTQKDGEKVIAEVAKRPGRYLSVPLADVTELEADDTPNLVKPKGD